MIGDRLIEDLQSCVVINSDQTGIEFIVSSLDITFSRAWWEHRMWMASNAHSPFEQDKEERVWLFSTGYM